MSSLDELINGTFQTVIGEIDELDPKDVKRVVMCSGKVYYDLLEQRRANNQKDVAIIRIEQLYPFPHEDVKKVLEPYAHVTDYVWCQEEPLNKGLGIAANIILNQQFQNPLNSNMQGVQLQLRQLWVICRFTLNSKKQLVEDALSF